jgi:SNF2 family DNA or RNA helicase
MFIQDNWDPDWQSTSSSKVTYLVQKLNALLEGNREVEGKSHMSDAKLLLLDNFSRTSPNTEKLGPEKVIIFSQFLEHIHVIEQQVVVVYHGLGTALCGSLHTIDG